MDLKLINEAGLQQFFDTMSPFLRNHCLRVEEYTSMIIKAMKDSGKYDNDINFDIMYNVGGRFARWHDIGKALISNSIWDSTEKLSDEEFALIKTHPILGAGLIGGKININRKYNVCEDIDDLSVASCLFHHERWDYKGYPFRIGGEDIPLVARVTALADSFDSMIDERPYKKSKTMVEAVEEINMCAGKQFDPQLAELFVISIEENLLHIVI